MSLILTPNLTQMELKPPTNLSIYIIDHDGSFILDLYVCHQRCFSICITSHSSHRRSDCYLFVILVGSFISRLHHKYYLKLPKHKIYVALKITFGLILFNAAKFNTSDKGYYHAYPKEWKGYLLILA